MKDHYLRTLTCILLLTSTFLVKAQTGKVPCDQYPFVKEDYSPNKPFYHIYRVDDFEIVDLKTYPKASRTLIYQLMIADAACVAPVFTHGAVTDCGELKVSPLGYVLTKLDPVNFTVTNYTLPDHKLANGKVTRHILQIGSKIVVRTTGVGNNQGPFWQEANNDLADLVWSRPNMQLYQNARKYLRSPAGDMMNTPVPDNGLTREVALLFAGTKTKLTAVEKQLIFQLLEVKIAPNNKDFVQYYPRTKMTSDQPFQVTVLPTDLDHDGTEEIFIAYGNCETSGVTCSQIAIFIKGSNGLYFRNYDDSGGIPEAVVSARSVPDLIIGGAGMTRPLLRWDGRKFNIAGEVDFSGKSTRKTTSIEVISKAYQQTIN